MSRTVGIFTIIAIIFSYLPMDMGEMGNCPEEKHHTNTRVDCGYAFHCPVMDSSVVPRLFDLSIYGWFQPMPILLKVEEFQQRIFHPPKVFLTIR